MLKQRYSYHLDDAVLSSCPGEVQFTIRVTEFAESRGGLKVVISIPNADCQDAETELTM